MDRPPSSSGFTMVSKNGMEPSSLLSSTVNFYGRVNTVNVMKEVLFVDFLIDDKSVIHKPATEPGVGWGAVLRAFYS